MNVLNARTRWCAIGLCLGLTGLTPTPAPAAEPLELTLQTRDPETGEIRVETEKVDPAHIAIVAVDIWNYHWCKTSAARAASFVPRMNRTLACARSLGIQVFHCPTDSIEACIGWPQVESVLAVEPVEPPRKVEIDCPAPPDGGGCTCGKERCLGCYGWDGPHPDLDIAPEDLMPNDAGRLYALCQQRGITHLLYMGFHTQVCLLGKSTGVRAMLQAGMRCVLARDLTDAHGHYIPAEGKTPDALTETVVAHFERYLCPTVNWSETVRAACDVDEPWIVDPVRFAPWGLRMRPHIFHDEQIVTLSIPHQPDAVIRYTLDGSEPSASSARYEEPLRVAEEVRIRAAAFDEDGRVVSAPSDSWYYPLPAEPPKPDVHISDIEPWRAVGPGHSPGFDSHRFTAMMPPPQRDKTLRGGPLRLHGKPYDKGMGIHAPNQLVYKIQTEWGRFVAVAGADEEIVAYEMGTNLAMHPSVRFRVFIDGKMAAESPVMRCLSEPWRFDVPIPEGARLISLATTDGGNGSREDYALWVDAGFVKRP